VTIVISDVVPLRSRGTWQGILNIIFTVGTATGASLGGYFADTIGWRWSFLLQVPLALACLIAVATYLHLPQLDSESGNLREKIKRVDFAGAITLLVTVSLLLIALDRGGDIGWHDSIARYSIIGFAVVAPILVFIEFEWAQDPFAPKRLIINKSMIASYLVNLFGISAHYQVLFQVPLYLQAVQGRTASQASLPLIFAVVFNMIGSVSSGLIMQSTGKYYWLSVVNFGLLFLGVVGIALGSGIVVSSMVMITAGLICNSLGIGQ
jgi:MFS family permease